MNLSEVLVDKQRFKLGKRIGRGGEGAVFALGGDHKYAVKIYTTKDLNEKESKIAAMVRAQLAEHAPLAAFPISIARNPSGAFVGFIMKLIDEHRPLHDLYSPGPRKQHFPQADYRFLVRAAANFSRAVASVHRSGCVIGDINHSGALVSPRATVSLIDADSFQFSGSGHDFLCKVGVPEYTPPELQGIPLGNSKRTTNHDAFGMAVVIFQLLFMGRHPFVGTVRRGDIPPIHENIGSFRYVYAETRDVGMDQPPGTPALSDFSPNIAALFDRAFSLESVHSRPTAEQWVNQLEKLEQSLERCQDNSLHYAPRDASECAWCEMERQTGSILFIPFIPTAPLKNEGFDPGVGGFDLDAIWRKIEAICRTLPAEFVPNVTAGQETPSSLATQARRDTTAKNPGGLLVAGIAIGLLFVFPKAWFVWLYAIYFGVKAFNEKKELNRTPFEKAYIDAESRWHQALKEWSTRCGHKDFIELKEELSAARDAYKALAEEERNLRAAHQSNRKERQLHAFLDKYDIRHGHIRGIGPAKHAILASYGIDTAADISQSRVLSVPGFGPVNSQGLFEWRDALTKRFVFQNEETEFDRLEMARIRSVIEAKAVPLRRKLAVGPHNLEVLASRLRQLLATPDPILTQIQKKRDQARADIAFLGIATPHFTPTTQSPTPTAPAQRPSSIQPPSGPRPYQGAPSPKATSTPKCPRCGRPMVKRFAKRGRNAGNYFWGCSRYPSCKGTKSL